MAKLDRKTQKIFGVNADANAITQFGTAKNTTPTYTTDVGTIQSGSAYQTGWANSLEDDLAPFMQDSNSLWYMITSQVAYIMQQGIAEYDAETEYPMGALCKVTEGNSVTIYKALQDMLGDNIGHQITDNSYWKMFISDGGLATYEIGLPQPTLSNNLLKNEVWLDGTVGTKSSNTSGSIVNISDYPELYKLWGTRFGGNGSTTFGLPNFTDKCLWGVNSLFNTSMTGFVTATLPNIKGSFSGSSQSADNTDTGATGAFYRDSRKVKVSNDGEKDNYYNFDAGRYNSIYQDNATVRPPSIKVRWKTRYV